MKKQGWKRWVNGILASLLTLSLAAVSLPVEAQAAPAETQKISDEKKKIENDIFWEDTDENSLYSQGGGIFKFGDTYYWYGVKYQNAPNYVKDPTKYYTSGDTYSDFESITCYSSKDLVNWTFERDVVTEKDVSDRDEMEGVKASWVGRLGVAKVGNTYVMLVQHECADPDDSLDQMEGYTEQSSQKGWSKQVLVLTSDSPTGKFEWNQRVNMLPFTGGTTNTGDQTIFTDEDTGKSYLVYSYGVGRGKIFLSEIVDLGNGKFGPSLEKNYMVYSGDGREGDCMFKYKDSYYICASDLYGWNASHAYYLKLDSLDDDYLKNREVSTSMELMDGCSDDYCHVTQTGFFYTVRGSKQETVIFCGDRWAEFAGNGLGFNQWCPLSFDESGRPYFNSLSSWYLDEATGVWNAAEDNNYVKNGSFDADRVSVTDLTGWTNNVVSGKSPIKNSGNSTTGKYGLALTDTTAFDCSVSQVIQSSPYVELPDGVYTLTAKMKNSEGFESLQLYAQANGLRAGTAVLEANADWTKVTLSDIRVTDGKVEIGIAAKGEANAYCYVDDITFVKTNEVSADAGTISGTIQSDIEGNILTITASQEDGTGIYAYEAKLTKGEQNFAISPVKTGTYSLSASTYGCIVEAKGTKNVAVTASAEASGVEFKVTNNMGSVKGKAVDENGEAVSDVTVTLSQGDWQKTTSTAENGIFEFTGVNAGDYEIAFEKTGYSADETATVTITKGETAELQDQVLKMSTGTIAGKVFGVDGKPAANATVMLRGCKSVSDPTRVSVTADENGAYTFENVVSGTYTITAANGQWDKDVNAVSQNVQVAPGETTDVYLDIPAEITIVNGGFENGDTTGWSSTGTSGKASNDTKHNHVYSGDCGYTTWDDEAFTISLEQKLTGLANGTYVVQMTAAAGTYGAEDELYLYAKNAEGEVTAKEDVPLTVNGGWELIGLTVEVTDGTLSFGLQGDMSANAWANFDDFRVGKVGEVHVPISTGVISGTVYDSTETPVANATVMLRGCNSIDDTIRASVQTDENGNYIFENVVPGSYAVSASQGKWDASVNAIAQDVKVVKGETTTLKLDIPAEITIINGGFENGDTTGWSSTGTSGKASNDTKHNHVYSGDCGYTTWDDEAFTISLEQKLTGLANGTYVVQMTAAAGTYGAEDELYLYAKNAKGEVTAKEDVPLTVNGGWELIGLTVEVTDGTLSFGLKGNMPANAWANFDDFRVGKIGGNAVVEADKAELEALISEVKGFNTSAYTAASIREYEEAIQKALENAEAVQKNETAAQEAVNAAVKELNAAFTAAKDKLVTLEVKLAQDIADSIKDVKAQGEYTEDSWKAYEEALKSARELQGSSNLTEEKLDQAIADLQTAVSELKERDEVGGKTDLDSLISEVKEFDTSAYTAASIREYEEAIQKALADAEAVQKDEAVTQEKVDAAAAELKAAFAEAKGKLVTLEAKLAQNIADSIKDVKAREEYTEDSWEAYEEALKAARALQGNSDLTEEELDQAIADLQTAVSELTELGDKEELEALISEIKNFDLSAYTSESVSEYQAVMQEALNKAEEVINNDNATQREIDIAVSELKAAFVSAKEILVKAPVGPEPDDGDDKPVKPGDNSDNKPSAPDNSNAQNPTIPDDGKGGNSVTSNADKGNAGKPVNNASGTTAAKTSDTVSSVWFAVIAAAAVICLAGVRRRKRQ